MQLTCLNLPVAALPSGGGRSRSFIVRPVPSRTVELAESLLMSVNTDAKAMHSIYETFLEFRQLNPGLRDDVAFLLFLIDAVVQGLKASSAITYGRTILSALQRCANVPLKSPLVSDTFRMLELICAGEETAHALDISQSESWELLSKLHGDVKIAAWFMLVAGVRCKDQSGLLKRDFRFTEAGSMLISFRWTKNHRSRGDRYSIFGFVTSLKHDSDLLR